MNFIEYVKQLWKNGPGGGTPWSAARLNHMEDGIKNNNSMISELNNNNICTNLLNSTRETSSQNGITCTNNGDGTYTLNGTASDNTVFVLKNTADIIKENANKTLRFVSKGDTLETYYVQVYFNNATPAKDLGSGITFKVPTNVSETNVAVAIKNGAVLHNIIIKPMLTTNLNATYNDFVSYTGNTGRLNADVALLKNNLDNNIIETLDNHSISSVNNINMDSELFSSHKPLYIHAVSTQNPSSITGMPQGAYGYGVLITLLSKYESTWGTCQIYIPHSGEVSRDIYVRTLGDTYKRKPSWRRIESTQIGAT